MISSIDTQLGMRLPDFIVIGAQKSASTFIHQNLAAHPDIAMPDAEEPFFEHPDFLIRTSEDFGLSLGKYREKIVGIKRPNYLGKPEAAQNIYQTVPTVKLIAVLRNPIDRAVAAYNHQVRFGTSPYMEVNEAMRLLFKSEAGFAGFPRSREIIEFGMYYKGLSRFLRFFGQKQIKIFLHEEVLQDPRKCVTECYKFLGVDSDFEPISINSRPMSGINHPTRLKLMSFRAPYLYEYNDDRTRLFPKSMGYSDYAIAGAATIFDRYVLKPLLDNSKPVLEGHVVALMKESYRDDVKKLSDLMNVDLTKWTD